MPHVNPYSQHDPMWPEPPVKWPGRKLAPLPKPPMPRDLEDEPANEKEPYIINPDERPVRPPKGDIDTGQPMGPAFAKMPRQDQRASVDQALIDLMLQRDKDPQNLALRDREHEEFSRYMLQQLGPGLGHAVVAASVPAYSAAKAVAQPLGFMKDATPPSFREVKAGLSPLWRRRHGMNIR